VVLKLLADASVMLWQCFEYTEAFKEIFEIGFTALAWERSGNMLGWTRNCTFKQREACVREKENKVCQRFVGT